DVSQLGQDVAQVAVVGQRVTIAGVQADGAFRARDITRTEGAASASPRTGNGDARPTSVDDCKDGGYLKYGFKNQGQCVSSVTPGKERN
ncbi:MAG TPA: hypothetical protein VNN07_18445, partial [Candidatus Tectomicrobia bacterium]|nr:hypothetical protein [Candidatus Tectomicrobia bacterium]